MNQPHYDQLAPIDGVHQVMPDGSISTAGASSPFEAPSLPPEHTAAFQKSVAEQVATQREQLAKPAANIDFAGAPHFLLMRDGEEVCGQCTEPFPCEAYRGITTQARIDQLTGADPHGALIPPTMEEAAKAAGLDPTEFEDRLRQFRGF